MSEGRERVRKILSEHGLGHRIQTLDASTHTADDAARALEVSVQQIAKSIVFQAAHSGRAIVVVTSGQRRINEEALAGWLEEPVKRARPEWVRAQTGYPIGGVSPLGHEPPTIVVLDRALWAFDTVYAAAGDPRSVVNLAPEELRTMTSGVVLDAISD